MCLKSAIDLLLMADVMLRFYTMISLDVCVKLISLTKEKGCSHHLKQRSETVEGFFRQKVAKAKEMEVMSVEHRALFSQSVSHYGASMEFRSLSVILYLPRATLMVEPQSPVFTGESVTLKCEIESCYWIYQWYKGCSSNVVHQSETNTFTISSAADQDQYWCKGERDDSPSSSQFSNPVTLTVKDLPSATLTVEPRWSPVFSGESVTLTCEIESVQYSNWRYQWYKGSSRTAVHQSQTNTFTISLKADQDQDWYWCSGERDERPMSSQHSNTVSLKVKDRPKAVVSIQPGDQVFRGEAVTLTCDIQGGGVSNWQYSWFKDGSSTPVSNDQQYSISSVTESHRGKYTCRGTVRGTSRSSHTSDAVTLTVSELPRATLTVEPESRVFSGESVTLKCEISTHDGWTYQWYKQNKQSGWTAVSQSVYDTVNRDTLTIRGDVVIHGDQYRCRGERHDRPTSSQYSDSVTLTVKALPRATLTVEPKQSVVFTGESVTLKCEIESYSNWRYQWYKGSSRTAVTEKPKPELRTSHKGAALIGNPVVLYCKLGQSAGWKFYWSKHTQSPENETKTERHSYTISSVSVSDGGQYWCRAGRGNPVYYTHYSDALWINVTGTIRPVSLMVSPSRTQHFTLDSLSLSCEGQSDSTGWRVRRYTHSEKVSDCSSGWGSVTGSTCNISFLYTSHTGVYWCESESGESSNPVNITVTNGEVILDSPVHPVTEGDPLTLRCLYRYTTSSNLIAEFYKDGSLLQTQTTGEMTIRTVSKSDEGLYHCKYPKIQESPKSWISVKEAPFPVLGLFSSLMAVFQYLLVTIVLVIKCYRARGQ
ncbi:hypothetical protein MHYP_G00013870 [Metynnis hypsauchen]